MNIPAAKKPARRCDQCGMYRPASKVRFVATYEDRESYWHSLEGEYVCENCETRDTEVTPDQCL